MPQYVGCSFKVQDGWRIRQVREIESDKPFFIEQATLKSGPFTFPAKLLWVRTDSTKPLRSGWYCSPRKIVFGPRKPNMNLSADRFFKNSLEKLVNGQRVACARFGYESHDAIYDVDVIAAQPSYYKNCRPSEKLPIHTEIEKHFQLPTGEVTAPKKECCAGGPQWGYDWNCHTLP